MLWSNWHGAIWRGPILVLLLWTGPAWTQTAPPAGAERIMVVHENGKATRCRVLESWQLPDRRVAHLLQAVGSGEMITIVDDQAPVGDVGDVKNTRSMAKRIFAWGAGRLTPPAGSPIPPQLRIDSGLVLKNEGPPPKEAMPSTAPAIVNRVVDDKALPAKAATPPASPVRVAAKEQIKVDGQIVEFSPPVLNVGGQAPPPTAPLPTVPPPSAPAALPLIPITPSTGVPAPAAPPRVVVQPTALPQVQPPAPIAKLEPAAPPASPAAVAPPNAAPPPTTIYELPPGTIIEPETKRSWRPGDKLQAWLLNRSAARESSECIVTQGPATIVSIEKVGEPKKNDAAPKAAFSTAMSTATPPNQPADVKPISTQPGIDKVGALPALETAKPGVISEKRDVFGLPTPPLPTEKTPATSAKQPEAKIDPLFAPDLLTPNSDKLKVRPDIIVPVARPTQQWPLNSQSALAANSGMQGPVTYVPYPIVTVPAPHQPPTPPDPKLPDAPQLNAFVNAFTPPPMPNGQGNPGQPGMMPQGNPMMAQQQQMMYQQMMQQQMMQQAMAQQRMMPNGDPRMAYLQPQGPNSMMAPYRQPPPSSGPMANGARQYQGPMPPNLVPGNAPMQAGFMPPPQMPMIQPRPPMPVPQAPAMPQQQPTLQPVSYQQPAPAPGPQSPVAQQIEQLIKTMYEAPYPSQREWAAQQLMNFEWRAQPQILQALLKSASHDPAVSVRAGCIYCLGRMQASVEPVLGALNAMRSDAEPRVRQEVESALARLGQTPAATR